MLSYRHGFHAGNPADVLKHGVLVFCLEYLKKKEKPFLCIDTHGGAGLYPLTGGYAAKNREWEAGIGRFPAPDGGLPPMLKNYLKIIAGSSRGYPGSPEIIRALIRPQDKAVCFELHPEDFRSLAGLLKDDRRFLVRREDGFAGLKSLLPPPSRRGLVLIDPAYEEKEDYATVPDIAAGALRRFPTGTYIIWYPLLARYGVSEQLPAELLGLSGGNRCGAELYTAPRNRGPENSPRGMYGSGLAIFNPPWSLKSALEETLPVLAARLGTGKGGWKLCWEAG
ncbi:MAG: 23S rRNA (adenine(2030)-N(6))-methyltransferase RlmJ [Treponema sp.]|jgi:23S rRNA (adenine2030-N6)-methyltransferase|nr:23S rRNA (adenine(2030)-N(6))-methyltransferase RlmJ [Treponema sp.]